MHELTMFYGLMTIVYGKLWTVVQTFQTERAFLFCPNRITILTRYGLFWTLMRTLIATNTLVFHHVEMLGLALAVVGEVIPACQPMGKAQVVKVACLASHSPFRYLSDGLFCFFRFSHALLVIRHVK